MNVWSVDGCREHRERIVGWLAEARDKAGLGPTLVTAFQIAIQRPAWFRIDDPLGSLVDEAIRRAAESEKLPKNREG